MCGARSACIVWASYAPMRPSRTAAELTLRDATKTERSLRVDESHVEQVEECAKQRRVVACGRVYSHTRGERRSLRLGKRACDGGQQRAPLGAAGAVADGVRQEHVAQLVELRDILRAAVSRRHERQGAAPALRQRLPGKRAHAGAVGDMPVLHRRFEPRRMREPARGERPSRSTATPGNSCL